MFYRFDYIIVCLLFAFGFVKTEAKAEEISIIVVGDITIGSELVPIIDRDDGVEVFAGITELIKSADIATAPLNMPISDRGEPRYGAEHTYRAPPVIARRLANVGFNVVSLATPHIMDFGSEALADTIDLLDWYHVRTVGASPPPPAPDADSEETDSTVEPPEPPPNLPKAGPASIRVKSAQAAFLAYYRANQFAAAPDDPIAHAVYSEMLDDVKAVKGEAELVVVWIHWGKARQTQAVGSRQRYFARGLIDAGADLVLCQRLHTLQGAEIYNGKPIIYSLADFIYEAYDKQYSKVVVPKITFSDGAFKSIELIPIWVDNPEAKYQPQVLSGEGAREALTNYQKLCADLKTPMTIEGERGWIREEAQ
jgi:poly-gamma-glutamate capsule biosynthesis protein CapA/YwtB (metallophosphatase superfamily)